MKPNKIDELYFSVVNEPIRLGRREFIKKLGGTPIGHDIFGRDVFEGDFIVYAPSGGFSGTSMKVGKIVRVETNQLRYGITYVLHLETARKRSGSC